MRGVIYSAVFKADRIQRTDAAGEFLRSLKNRCGDIFTRKNSEEKLQLLVRFPATHKEKCAEMRACFQPRSGQE